MGKNKQTRKQIAGQLRTIALHENKIAQELQKPSPDLGLLRKWEREIDSARKKMRKLESRLGK